MEDKLGRRSIHPISDNLSLLVTPHVKYSFKLYLPILIGFFVYGYTKLCMLGFYYDFVEEFTTKENYQYCAMDTDSAYIALSGQFESMVAAHKLKNAKR